MNRLVFFVIILLLHSCSYFEKQKLAPEDLLNEELSTFNWNDVDTYPSFKNCDSVTGKVNGKQCFENLLLDHVNAFLLKHHIVVANDVYDTIRLRLIINNVGKINVESIKVRPTTKTEIPEIENLLRASVKDVPKIYPAIKRGQPVTTAFELPVIVKIN